MLLTLFWYSLISSLSSSRFKEEFSSMNLLFSFIFFSKDSFSFLEFSIHSFVLFKILVRALYNVCKTRVDLPPPDTPVIEQNTPVGKDTSTFFKLCPLALTILIHFLGLNFLLYGGIGIHFLPLSL